MYSVRMYYRINVYIYRLHKLFLLFINMSTADIRYFETTLDYFNFKYFEI